MAIELVSALLDGECSAAELRGWLEDTTASAPVMQQWTRMNLVREALAGNPVQSFSQVNPDLFCAGIMAQLGEMEPATAPVSTAVTAVATAPTSNVVSFPTRARPAAVQRGRRTRPLVGWAAAASVTLVALAGGRALFDGNADSQPGSTSAVAVASNGNNGGGLRNVSYTSNGGHFGLMPVSARAYLGNVGTRTQMHWTHFDSEDAQTSRLMAEQNHLAIEQGMEDMQAYTRMGNSYATYQTVSDPH